MNCEQAPLESLEQKIEERQEEVSNPETTSKDTLKDFLALLEKEESIEKKIQLTLEIMKDALSHCPSPRFRDFWEARKICLPFFKEKISSNLRAEFWKEYTDLSVEARRIKEFLDEQSAFACEQIEL